VISSSLAIIISAIIKSGVSIAAECKFGCKSTYALGNRYTCNIENQLDIEVIENRTIDEIIGTHGVNKNNFDVLSFVSNEKKALYFPKGLEKFFKNLQKISIERGQMKEIKQDDLKPFSELEELVLGNNDIEVLEDGLFDFNPKLKFISFWHSKIFHIDRNVFNNLNYLTHLWLIGNKCINVKVDPKDTSMGMQAFITKVKDKCYNLVFVEVRKNLNKLENTFKILGQENYKHFIVKINNLENRFKSSKFSHYLLFKNKFQSFRTDPKYVEYFNFHTLQKPNENFNSEQNKINENVDNCSKVCHSKVSPDIQNLDTFLKSTISSVSALSQKIDNFECRNEQKIESDQKSTETDEFDEIRNQLSLIEDKIESQESILNEFYNKFDDIVN